MSSEVVESTEKSEKPRTKVFMVQLPELTYKRLKLAAATRGCFVKSLVLEAIEQKIADTPGLSHIEALADVPEAAAAS